jgi:hypothetical protein
MVHDCPPGTTKSSAAWLWRVLLHVPLAQYEKTASFAESYWSYRIAWGACGLLGAAL